MKSFALIVVIAQLAVYQTSAQIIRGPVFPSQALLNGLLPGPCGCGGPVLAPPVIAPQVIAPQVLATPQVIANPQLIAPSLSLVQPNSVANNLADTLSLLTVSSLLSETLPYGAYPNVVGLPAVPSCGGYPYPYFL